MYKKFDGVLYFYKILFIIYIFFVHYITPFSEGDIQFLKRNIKKTGKIDFAPCHKNADKLLKFTGFRDVVSTRIAFAPTWSQPGVNPKAKTYVIWCYSYTFHAGLDRDPRDRKKPNFENYDNEMKKFTTGLILPGYVIPSYTAALGLYEIKYHMQIVKQCKVLDQLKKELNGTCYFRIIKLRPMVMIQGGSYREVHVNTPIRFNAIYDNPNKEQDKVTFRWNVHVNSSTKSIIKYGKNFILNKSFTRPGTSFDVVFYAKLVNKHNEVETQGIEHQDVKVVSADKIILEIDCHKNCPPYIRRANYQSEVFLQVKCLSNCDKVLYTWTIYWDNGKWEEDKNINYEKDTDYGRHNERFITKKRVLSPKRLKTSFKFEVKATNSKRQKGIGYINAKFTKPEVSDCQIHPNKGISFKTTFNYACEVAGTDTITLELYFDHPDKGGVCLNSGISSKVSDDEFFLPPSKGHKFFVRAFNFDKTFTVIAIKNIQVESLFNKKTNNNHVVQKINDVYSKGDKSIEKLMQSPNAKDRNKALSTLTILLENIKNSNTDDKQIKQAVEDLKYKVSQNLENSPIDNFEDVMQYSDSIVRTMGIDESKNGSDPFLFQITQMVCKKLAKHQLGFMQKESYQQTFDFEAHCAADKLVQCTEMNAMPNQTAIDPIDLNLTTVLPTITGGIEENYPDYLDYSEEYYRNLLRYKEATDCAVNTTILSAKVIALTMAIGEGTLKKTFGKAQIMVAKDKGSLLCNRSIQSQGVQVIPSPDWKHSDHNFDILISTWSRDIMWWNPNHTKVSSDIIKIEFWHSTCKDRVNGFIEPADLIFKLKENETKYVLLNDSINATSEMSLFRVQLNFGELLKIVFFNLTKDDFLDVTITINSIPMPEDFKKNNFTVTKNSTIHYTNPHKLIDYAYIGVLPNAKMTRKSNLNYSVSFVKVLCVSWETNTSRWIPQCHVGPKSNLTHLTCRCNNFSIISTSIVPAADAIKVKLEIEKDFLLVLDSRYVVFGTIFIVFAMYCGFCTFFFKQHSEEVFFLSDNQESNEYGYVIIIRTGSGRHASTASNVVIKLTGDKSASEPHLLNFPDPQMRILQRNNQDLFILTTKASLGDHIDKIELWYDSVGFNSTWYCHDVYVYDLQKRTHWYFKVKQQLCVVSGVTYIAVNSTESEEERKKGRKKRCWCTIRLKVCDMTHGWMFLREEETFTRFQRLTLLLSNIMLTFLLVLIWQPLPKFELRDCLDQRRDFQVDARTAMKGSLSALTSFGVHFCMSWFMRLLKRGGMAFKIFTKICWTLIFFNIIFSTNALVIYGFWIPFYSSLDWLMASIIGLSISAIFYENLMIMLRSMCNLRWQPDMMWRYNMIMEAIDKQKRWLFDTFGPELLRPYFGHVYSPMTKEQEQIRKRIISLRRLVLEQLWDFVMFSIYILILYMVILMNKSSVSQLSNANMKNEVEGVLTRSKAFSDISTFLEVYDYMEKTLIPVLQDPHWYGNFVFPDPGLMVDMNNKYLGVVRLRQHRMPKGLCNVPDKMKFLNMSCWPEFSLNLAETGSFGYRWEKNIGYLMFDRLQTIWEYTSAKLAGTLPILGTFATYSGGGYVSFLGRTLHNSVANFRQFKEKKWIDDETRCIFIEFLTYNVNHNEFNAITMTFEQSATGYLNKKVTVQTARMLFIESTFEMIKRIIFALFIIWVGILLMKQSSTFLNKIKTFYKDVWFYVDFFIISMSAVCIGTFYIRTLLIEDYIDKLTAAKHNEFVHYFELFYLEDFLTIFGAILVCVATVRMWRFLRFGKVFRMMERTLSLSGSGLLSILLLHLVFILAYAMAGVMLYGIEFGDFYSPSAAIRTLMLLVMFASFVDYDEYIKSETISYFFFATYSIVVIVMMTLYGIVLMEAYVRAQQQFAEQEDSYTIISYFQEKLKYWPIKWRYKILKLKGGQDDNVAEEKTFVWLKSGDVRHENSVSIQENKLEGITAYARCIIKNLLKPKEKIQVLPREMMGILMIYLNKLKKKITQQEEDNINEEENEEAVFFTGHLPGERIQCVDENRMLLMKNLVERMLQKPNNNATSSNVKPNKIERCSNVIRKSEDTLKRTEEKLNSTLAKFEKFQFDFDKTLKQLPKDLLKK